MTTMNGLPTTAIKYRPMMFRPELVRALLDGRKTQTRRVINPQPPADINELHGNEFTKRAPYDLEDDEDRPAGFGFQTEDRMWQCPWRVGDRIYVQEAAIKIGHERTGKNGQYLWPKLSESFDEAAARRWFDQSCLYTLDLRRDDPAYDEPHGTLNKMFMPRWASRITLEITDVRVERLQDITSDDAAAEGVGGMRDMRFAAVLGNLHSTGHRLNFMDLWNEINGPDAWKANPWVWVITFKRPSNAP